MSEHLEELSDEEVEQLRRYETINKTAAPSWRALTKG
jgi:hypothetical protein